MKTKPEEPAKLNIFSRFIEIWKPNYLQKTIHEKGVGGIWGFHFFWSTVISIVATFALFQIGSSWWEKEEPNILAEIPAFNFVFEDHVLIESGLEEPYRYDIEGEGSGNDFTFIIDRSGDKYDQESIQVLDNVILITGTEAIIKDQDERSIALYPYNEVEELKNTSFNKDQAITFTQNEIIPFIKTTGIIVVGIMLWFFLCIIRLMPILFWAFITWMVGKIAQIEDFTYGKAFLFTLSTNIIPLLIDIVLLSTGLAIPFATFIFTIIIAAMNCYEIKKS